MAREANDQLAASKEQLVVLKKQLEEAQRLRDQAEKAKVKVEKAKAQAERERDEAEQHGYDVGVVETENALRAEVPVVCRAYCTQTWEEALNRAGIDASSELRKLENIIFPPAYKFQTRKRQLLQSPSQPKRPNLSILPHPVSRSRTESLKL